MPPVWAHWYICKNENLDDIAAYEAKRGPPKKKMKKASSSNTVSSSVVATPASGMVFPYNEAVPTTTQKPKRVKKAAKTKGPPPTTSTSRSRARSNDPFPLQVKLYPAVHEDIEVSPHAVKTPRKKRAIMKKCTPRRVPVEVTNPSSPASNTRSKR
ncbi:hypothetical protein QOZ80_5BG0433110 [Eleusine coracana subsp. coracana]|nr:hypothetical protein QOZ80_5BG0433110 [Eleusine coracana subsp. coracana]